MATILEITVNCPAKEIAEEIAEKVLAARLAAAANISGPIESLYHWDGKTRRAQETVLKLKTRPDLFVAVAELVVEIHPYEVPSILGQRVELTTDDYSGWLADAIADRPGDPT